MKYLHIKNIEKYHPKFKDRDLVWCKLYFATLNTDPEFMLLDEIDKWRYFAFVMLELQLKKHVPLEPKFLTLKGFDFRKRKLDITINAIRDLIELCNNPISERYQNDTLDKEEDKEEDKEKNKIRDFVINKSTVFINTWTDYMQMRRSMRKYPTNRAKELLIKKLESLSVDENEQIKILNQSTEHNWIGLFELKGSGYGKSRQNNTKGIDKYAGIGETIKTEA